MECESTTTTSSLQSRLMKSKIALVIATSNDLHTFVMRASRVESGEFIGGAGGGGCSMEVDR